MTTYTINFVQKQMTADYLKANPMLKNKRKKVLSQETGTLAELVEIYTTFLTNHINIGKQTTCERGTFDINLEPKTIEELVDNLNKGLRNGQPFHKDYEDRFYIA